MIGVLHLQLVLVKPDPPHQEGVESFFEHVGKCLGVNALKAEKILNRDFALLRQVSKIGRLNLKEILEGLRGQTATQQCFYGQALGRLVVWGGITLEALKAELGSSELSLCRDAVVFELENHKQFEQSFEVQSWAPQGETDALLDPTSTGPDPNVQIDFGYPDAIRNDPNLRLDFGGFTGTGLFFGDAQSGR